MANEGNLKKFGSEREPREAGRKGGKASGEARRKKRQMQQAAKLLLNMPVVGENAVKNLETLGFSEEDMTNQMALLVRVFQKALQTGDVRAAEFLRDTAGYNPETNLKERQFKYEKDKEKGINQEIEDTSETDESIYGNPEEKDNPVASGMEMIYKQLMSALTELGVTPIEAIGKEFDPNFHNAVMHVEDETLGENTVAEEFQKGYIYRETVVRHSMVKVAN